VALTRLLLVTGALLPSVPGSTAAVPARTVAAARQISTALIHWNSAAGTMIAVSPGMAPERASGKGWSVSWKGVIAATVALTAIPVLADQAQEVRNTMRAALIEHAPLPSGPAALPDSAAPVMPRAQVATRADAERAARARARRDATAARADAANHAAARATMGGWQSGGAQYGCGGQAPADMMKSRGKMPGGGMMPGGTGGGAGGGGSGSGGEHGGGGSGGTPGGAMLVGPSRTSTGAPSQGARR
jgi:hypothetical protein